MPWLHPFLCTKELNDVIKRRILATASPSLEREAKYRINYDVNVTWGRFLPLLSDGDTKLGKLLCKSPVEFILRDNLFHLRVDDTRLVAKVVQVACSNKTITPVIARTANDQHPWVAVQRILLRHGGSNAEASKLHQLVNGEATLGRHEVYVNLDCTFLIQERAGRHSNTNWTRAFHRLAARHATCTRSCGCCPAQKCQRQASDYNRSSCKNPIILRLMTQALPSTPSWPPCKSWRCGQRSH
mmetsp:Transcript_83998/g.166819  ORF Transcript_83998/g.166819 Transcript_83998/m.166819 type:complete len:242 (+) Transcript_83998:289-1014(+)